MDSFVVFEYFPDFSSFIFFYFIHSLINSYFVHNVSWSYPALTPLYTFIPGAHITSTAHLHVLLLQHYLFIHLCTYLPLSQSPAGPAHMHMSVTGAAGSLILMLTLRGQRLPICLFLQQLLTVLFVFPPLKINCSQKFLSFCFSFKFLTENIFFSL